MKKVIILFLTLIFTTSFVLLYFSESTYANEIEGDNYQSLQQDGILDNTVSEDQWNQFLQESESGKQSLENDSEIVSYSSGFRLKAGDVLISNATSSKGLTGHAAIAISSNQVLHIHSAGHHPAVHSFSWFKKRYSGKGQWLKIYRSKNSKAGPKAAAWAKKNYVGKKYNYGINTKLSSKNPTYCSKIVYQAYKYGASKKSIYDPGSHIIAPYALPNISSKSYKLRKVKTF
ncbi:MULTISPECIES: YiiX/YebB-like N1pC/P60 family cysteine hydrolase [Staphylococcus]|uniref:Uncharacterized distant relative of cell wall-associated hydrolases n=1 Tax=Staphylococcus schleiferi TaxID=1295 RepID=A0A7Z7QRM2_STASC|nr:MULTISPECIES: YiiX/YebB-like N1pC/P60 family cysteine hydrolase [Staphylococcus]QGS46602.1 hypothetical protein FOB90_07865 [Mammaliicoccus fleurettii]EPD49964.1 hypothetical protein HMPREF1208_01500 [Staphylococcus sp. HGB0015]MBF1992551.1 hypothetical protein [Staphylococcus schleiferi]MBF2039017.1 hypothetical protein [Staphylococcus schleiferi]MBF2100049.1 hypothetical protein [Staphylococcus schleiferi]